jgi:hypothetical protein
MLTTSTNDPLCNRSFESSQIPNPGHINPGKNLKRELLTQHEEILIRIERIVVRNDSSGLQSWARQEHKIVL